MTRYAALLRGINLGSRNKIGMPDLRELFQTLGHTDVETYLQSGNVIFTSADDDPSLLAADLEKRIAADLGVNAAVLLRTADHLAQIVGDNPFLRRTSDLTKLHVTFLAEEPDGDRASRLEKPSGEPAEFSLAGREVYLHCPNGYGRTKLNNAYLEKRLGVAATTRNWRTVTSLRELTSGR